MNIQKEKIVKSLKNIVVPKFRELGFYGNVYINNSLRIKPEDVVED